MRKFPFMFQHHERNNLCYPLTAMTTEKISAQGRTEALGFDAGEIKERSMRGWAFPRLRYCQ